MNMHKLVMAKKQQKTIGIWSIHPTSNFRPFLFITGWIFRTKTETKPDTSCYEAHQVDEILVIPKKHGTWWFVTENKNERKIPSSFGGKIISRPDNTTHKHDKNDVLLFSAIFSHQLIKSSYMSTSAHIKYQPIGLEGISSSHEKDVSFELRCEIYRRKCVVWGFLTRKIFALN